MDEKTFRESYAEGPDGCLIWTRGTGGGYGYCLLAGRYGTAHRAAFYLEHGRWPDGNLHHECGNRLCVNVEHLREVTRKQHAAIHWSNRTHCKNGHEFVEDSFEVKKGRYGNIRICIPCRRARSRAYMRRKHGYRTPVVLP